MSATDTGNIIFYIPNEVTQFTVYTYRMKTRADSYPHIDAHDEDFTFRVLNKPDITVTCASPYYVTEGDNGITLDCSASSAPGDNPRYTWSWSPTTNLTDHNTATPMFAVPGNVDRDTTYTYTVTASAANAEDGTAEVTVTVRNTYTTAIHCPGNPYSVDEGSDRYKLDCRVENPPTNVSRGYHFTSPGNAAALAPLDFSRDDSPILHFTAPPSVDADTTYEYTFTISVGAGELHRAIASRDFTVTVRDTDTDSPVPVFICNDSEVYEATADFMLDCLVTDEPSGATYAWAARGSTLGTDDLTNTDSLKATFSVPDNVDADTDYDYTVTLSAGGADVAKR